jgi:hypothetical protein
MIKRTSLNLRYILVLVHAAEYITHLPVLFVSFVFLYCNILGMPEGKKPLGRPRRRWVDNIKMDLRQIGWDGIDWIDLAQDRDQWRALVNTVMNLRVP